MYEKIFLARCVRIFLYLTYVDFFDIISKRLKTKNAGTIVRRFIVVLVVLDKKEIDILTIFLE